MRNGSIDERTQASCSMLRTLVRVVWDYTSVVAWQLGRGGACPPSRELHDGCTAPLARANTMIRVNSRVPAGSVCSGVCDDSFVI